MFAHRADDQRRRSGDQPARLEGLADTKRRNDGILTGKCTSDAWRICKNVSDDDPQGSSGFGQLGRGAHKEREVETGRSCLLHDVATRAASCAKNEDPPHRRE